MNAANRTVGVESWDTEWAAEKAAEALRVLDEHEEAAHQAATRGEEAAYLEALRSYCRAGRDEALRIRRGAA